MIKSVETIRSVVARPPPQSVRTVGFSAWILYPPGGAQEGSPFQGFPTWRFRVLKTALRLRPRRALSSAPGQRHYVNLERLQNGRQKSLRCSGESGEVTNTIKQ